MNCGEGRNLAWHETLQGHERIFTYMLKMGLLYPSYNLEQLLTNDLQTAKKALHMD